MQRSSIPLPGESSISTPINSSAGIGIPLTYIFELFFAHNIITAYLFFKKYIRCLYLSVMVGIYR
jgi:hypothetical protein